MTAPDILVAGIGATGPSSLDPATLAAIHSARLLVGGRRHLAWFRDHPAEKLTIGANVETLLNELEHRLAGARETGPPPAPTCVVLASGDPCCHGIGPRLVERFGRDRVWIVPAVGSVPLLFNRLGIDWSDVCLLSAHGRPLEPVIARALGETKLAILTDDRHTPGVVAEALIAAGLESDARAVVGECLGGPDERLTDATLADLPGRAFDRLNVLAILRDPARVRRPIAIGRPDDAYAHRAGMITKAEIRAICLGLLRLDRAARVWDVGAGCGSLAIEAAGLADRGTVWAIEPDPDQVAFLRENVRRYAAPGGRWPPPAPQFWGEPDAGSHRRLDPASNAAGTPPKARPVAQTPPPELGGAGGGRPLPPAVHIVPAAAPEALADLPDPDAVFVGGSGGRLIEILAVAAERIRPGGRIVATFAIVEHLAAAREFWRARGWPVELSQISVARGQPIGDGLRLAALNPIFILAATRPVGGRDGG